MKWDKNTFGIIFGIMGSLTGLYIWKDFLPHHYGDNILEWKSILRLQYFIFLYIPSCLAFISIFFKKNYLMYLSVLISLPISKYLGIKPLLIESIPLENFPLYCYILSAILISLKKEL